MMDGVVHYALLFILADVTQAFVMPCDMLRVCHQLSDEDDVLVVPFVWG